MTRRVSLLGSEVEVSYPWSAVTILIGSFFGSSVTLQSSSTMQVRR